MTSRQEQLRESWNDVAVQTTSPNGCVFLTNVGDREFRLTCEDAWFHRASLDDFTTQLNRLFALALVDRTRSYNRQREMVTGVVITPVDATRNPHVADFVEKRNSLTVEGASGDGLVSITSVGLTRFAVTIDPQLWASRDRQGIERRLDEAGTALVRDQFRKMYELKQVGH